MKKLIKYFTILSLTLSIFGCTKKAAELGDPEKPILIFLVPGQNQLVLQENGEKLKKWLENELHLKFEISVPQNYIAIVEAFGSKRADIAFINTFGYILAHEKYNVHARLTGINLGSDHYYGQIITRKNHLKKIQDLKGKKFAFVDPSSTSGYLMPAKMLRDKKINPKEFVFAGRHDSVVSMVYQGQVDAGATYYTPPDLDGPQDARKLLLTQYPDVYSKIVIIGKTDPIPNDPVAFRVDFPLELENKIVDSMVRFSETPDGSIALKKLYNLTSFKRIDDSFYDSVRTSLIELGKKAAELVK